MLRTKLLCTQGRTEATQPMMKIELTTQLMRAYFLRRIAICQTCHRPQIQEFEKKNLKIGSSSVAKTGDRRSIGTITKITMKHCQARPTGMDSFPN